MFHFNLLGSSKLIIVIMLRIHSFIRWIFSGVWVMVCLVCNFRVRKKSRLITRFTRVVKWHIFLCCLLRISCLLAGRIWRYFIFSGTLRDNFTSEVECVFIFQRQMRCLTQPLYHEILLVSLKLSEMADLLESSFSNWFFQRKTKC